MQAFFSSLNKSDTFASSFGGNGLDCASCGLHTGCRSPKMKPSGLNRKKIFVLAEAPGAVEDENGTQLLGDAGQLLRAAMRKNGLDLDFDCVKTNAVACRPPRNRDPKLAEVKCCRPYWQQALKEAQPKVVWLLGNVALQSYFMGRVDIGKLNINTWRRNRIPDYENNCWVVPMFHPSFVLRNRNRIAERVFEDDIAWSLPLLNVPLPKKPEPQIDLLYTADDVLDFLEWVYNENLPIVFDYETTALKPYQNRNLHKIHCIGVSPILPDGEIISYAFPYQYPGHWGVYDYKDIREAWREVLLNPAVKKIAHNLQFEDKWSYQLCGISPNRVASWETCTMVTEHLIDSRKKRTALKPAVAMLRWGVDAWDKDVEAYIDTPPDSRTNRLHEVPLPDLLRYCALDAWYEHLLYRDQRRQLAVAPALKRCHDELFIPGAIAFSAMEQEGIPVDKEYYEGRYDHLEGEISKVADALAVSKEARLFESTQGREINWGSPKDLKLLFFDLMGLKPIRETKTGGSTDEDSLTKLKVEISELLIRKRKLEKQRNTYISMFLRSIGDDERLHPNYNMHIAESGRSSSDDPNFQNIPNRDPEAKELTRRGIRPKKGCLLLMADYSGAEVRVMPCYSGDKVLINYIHDPTTDMHRDQAMEIFMLPQEEISKPLRNIGKGNFVFPEFYGDYYKSVTQSIWHDMQGQKTASGVDIMDHLSSKGIRTIAQFEQHMERVEAKFWKLLDGTKRWKDRAVDDYLQKGYIELFTGFRRVGYLDRKQIGNTPIQGTAFHLLLWSLIQLDQVIRQKKWKSRIIGQIHDEIVMNVYPDELRDVASTTHYIMTEKVKEYGADWLIVPMDVEISISEIDGCWAEKKEYRVV